MSDFRLKIFSPDGEWTVKEIKKIIDSWFREETKCGRAYKVIYSVKN